MKGNQVLRALVSGVILSLLVSAVGLAAPIEVSFWTLFTGGDGQMMDRLVAQFNEEHPDITVTHTILDWGDPYYSKLITSTVGGAPPAVGVMHASRIKSFIQNGLLTPLTAVDLEHLGVDASDFMPNIWEWSVEGGFVYAIPLDVHPYALYMNVPMFEQAGLPVRAPESGDEFIQFARRLTQDRTGDGIADIAGYSGYGSREWLGFLYQFGGRIVDEAGRPAFNSAAGVRAMEFQRELIGATEDRIFGWIGDRTAAMQLTGPWSIGAFTEIGLEFATAPTPQVGDEPGTWADSHLLIIPSGVRELSPEVFEAALTFIRWLTENSIQWSATAGHVPARIDRLTVEAFLELEHQLAFAESLPFSYFWPDHRFDGEFHGQGVWPYLNDEISAGEALLNMERVFTNIMAEYAN